ncbi:FxSxx-COOH system tetratricopeptide repeat protein [Streptomyces sp. MBT62]|uniref:FxSxx-COOH system tetratricopeptide repeat protein n=1 Tax=Streptomyces sp. MBT62 TaxID=2800410 RepID=UPI00190C15FD|nr:FxSxx-COOH system tetratricopeptide repeat protein [Streptomyces sp. MBT62]MBK3565792.1 tetratricopeptide repeat protein [Streptomyces sp. MBT62]
MSGTRTPVGPVGGRAVKQTVTISFAGFNRAWAAWIGDRLERRGHRVVFARWDAPPEIPLVDLLESLKLAPGRVLIVVSKWYFQLGPRTYEEWNAALRQVVAPDPAKFAAVSVDSDRVPTATAVLAALDLSNVGANEAERRLLDRLDMLGEPLIESADGARRGPRFPSATPEVWGGVPRRNTGFTGREPLLNDAYHLLQDAEPGAGVLALYGMPGVGKTQLAAEYVYRFVPEYDVVWWVNAESLATYRRRLAELAPRLHLSTGADYGERLRAVRDALRRGEPYTRWLLVLDGADEPGQISNLVPTGPGHVLITSRNQGWREHNSQLMEVPVYLREESVAFIRRRAPRLTDTDADQLAEALEDLPLLLDQTAGWLNDSDLSVPDYIAQFESGLAVPGDVPGPFQRSWAILLQKLRQTMPESVDLLRLCTFFAPGFIPVGFLRELPTEELPERFAALLGDPVLWTKAIDQLLQYSVVRAESHEVATGEDAFPSQSLYLHRMVHQIVHQGISGEDGRIFVELVRRALAAADPGRPDDTRLWDKYAEIVPHLKYADVLTSEGRQVQQLVLNCLRYMYFSGEYTAGIKLGDRAMGAWRELLGEGHQRFWELAHHYANLLRAMGDYQNAEAVGRSVLETLRGQNKGQGMEYVRAVSGIAADLRGLARYQESLELSEWLVSAWSDLLGESDSRTLSAQNNLAVSLKVLGRYEDALEMDRRTLEMRRGVLGETHRETLWSGLSCAIDLRLLGRYSEAESIQTDNLRDLRRFLGADHFVTLRGEHSLAMCLYRGGDRGKAGPLLARVLERTERVLGETHPWTLIFAASQSCFAREHGDIDKAREVSESVLARYELAHSEGHPFIAGCRSNHSLILCNVGERDQAYSVAERSLAAMTAAVGENHPWTLGCAVNASFVRNLSGDPESAAELSRVTVSRAGEVLGRTHPLTLSARVALAADLRDLRNRQEAEKIEQEALSDLSGTLGSQHVHTVAARSRKRPYWDFEPLAV